MKYLFESRMYREELLRWFLIMTLAIWAMSATAFALSKKEKVTVIAVSDNASYVVQSTNSEFEKRELSSFMSLAIQKLYSFDEKTFDSNLNVVSDMMTEELWQMKRPEYVSLSEKLKKDPLKQLAEILSIETSPDGKVKADLNLTITHKLVQKTQRLRVTFEIGKRARSESNPYPYEIRGVKDETL